MRIVFLGTPDFALPSLEALEASQHRVLGVVTQPDRPKGRHRRLAAPPVKEWAVSRQLPTWQPDNLKDAGFLSALREVDPDVLVVVAYGKILPQEVLALPRYGCINLHASLLPRYRGAAPIHWAIINGEEETGVTTMFVAPQVDAGDIILQEAVPIGPAETAGQLHDRLAHIGAGLLVETLNLLEKGEAPRRPQDASLVTFARTLKPEDEAVDWRRTGREIFNRVRGLSPWPGAYTLWRGKRLKIYWAEPGGKDLPERAEPGKIVAVGEEGIEVACGDRQAVIIKEVQPEGKGKMPASAFVRGYRLVPGEVLG